MMKHFFKYLNVTNVTVGLLTLIFIGLIRYKGIPLLILNFIGLPGSEFSEYIISGFLGLITRLGIKGPVEELDLSFHIKNYLNLMMAGPDDKSSLTSNTGRTNTPVGGSPNTGGTGGSNTNTGGTGSSNTNTGGTGSSNTNTGGTGGSNTNTTTDSNSNTNTNEHNPWVKDLFDDPDFKNEYLFHLKNSNTEEYNKLKAVTSEIDSLEIRIRAHVRSCNAYGPHTRARYQSKIDDINLRIKDLKFNPNNFDANLIPTYVNNRPYYRNPSPETAAALLADTQFQEDLAKKTPNLKRRLESYGAEHIAKRPKPSE
uniref:Uncharacterized protein n=1 Tax=Colletotrichum lindemuthianum TaxID=290576 RepID=A0A2D2AJ54_COLLN|nr:hypothetical protein [Colletotrichum lindemuthianum]ATQ37182.1 hypothetical protein [Colletotrichum lindemuthianum]